MDGLVAHAFMGAATAAVSRLVRRDIVEGWSSATSGPNMEGLVALAFMGAATAAASRLVPARPLAVEAPRLDGGVVLALFCSPSSSSWENGRRLLIERRRRRLLFLLGRRLIPSAAAPERMVLP